MKSRFPLSKSTGLFIAGALSAISGALPALAQTLHPDWAQVWQAQSQPSERGQMRVPSGAVIPIALDRALSSSSARVGDIVTATPISRVAGDSEFPPGTRIGGVVSQADPASGTAPGVLDIDFQSALLPDGTDVPLRGFISSLDEGSVQTRGGHIIARAGRKVNSLTAVGIGGGIGFVLGRLLRTRTLVPTILGAAGGYLYARSNNRFAEDARIAAGTTLGVRLEGDVLFPDTSDYASVRLNFLETHENSRPYIPTFRSEVSAPSRAHYPEYVFVETRPSFVYATPFDFYGFPLFIERPRSYYYGSNPYSYGPYPFSYGLNSYNYGPYPYGYPYHSFNWDGYRHNYGGNDDHHRDINSLPRFGDGVPFRPSRGDGNHFGDGGNHFGDGSNRPRDYNDHFAEVRPRSSQPFERFNAAPRPSTAYAPKPSLPAPRFDTPRERPSFQRPQAFRPMPRFDAPRERPTFQRSQEFRPAPFSPRPMPFSPRVERAPSPSPRSSGATPPRWINRK